MNALMIPASSLTAADWRQLTGAERSDAEESSAVLDNAGTRERPLIVRIKDPPERSVFAGAGLCCLCAGEGRGRWLAVRLGTPHFFCDRCRAALNQEPTRNRAQRIRAYQPPRPSRRRAPALARA